MGTGSSKYILHEAQIVVLKLKEVDVNMTVRCRYWQDTVNTSKGEEGGFRSIYVPTYTLANGCWSSKMVWGCKQSTE